MAFVVSIDTEEDNWVPARENIRVGNAGQLPRLNAFFAGLGVRPTYFVAHSIAVDPTASAIIQEIHRSGTAEIGAHLHAWNTPPLEDAFIPRHTMMHNLPDENPFDRKRQLAELRTVLGSVAGRTLLAENYAGLPIEM